MGIADRPGSKVLSKEVCAKIDLVMHDIRNELIKSCMKHAPMHSPHEGISVIREELDVELWAHVTADTGRTPEARKEAIQVAAMGARYVVDLIP